eukprot:207172-Pyramimonas_sp.AAC.1
MVAHAGDTGERHVQLREDNDERKFTSVSSVAAPPSIPRRISRNKEESMGVDSGVSRFCSSFFSRIMCHRACVHEGVNCGGQCSLLAAQPR